jgi:hypothetical protein
MSIIEIQAIIINLALFFGLITNLINMIIFSNKCFREKIFRYLIVHSISETLYFFFTILLFFPYCVWICPKEISSSYFSNMIILYIDKYLTSVLALFSLMIEMKITIQRYLVVKNEKIVSSINYLKQVGIIFTISSIVYMPELFFNKIIKLQVNQTESKHFYRVTKTDHGIKYNGTYSMVVNLIRGPIFVSVLTIFNLLTIIKFRKQMETKKLIKRISFKKSNLSTQQSDGVIEFNSSIDKTTEGSNIFISLIFN